MAITDDPFLNAKVNGTDDEIDISEDRYCISCGKQIIWNKTTKDGREDHYMEYKWKNKICQSCLNEKMSSGRRREI